ncbi:hypothetical protein B4079_4385 [Bacillus cereus]|nr:hypothetical protein B4079_4385 [Bacillus cereus]
MILKGVRSVWKRKVCLNEVVIHCYQANKTKSTLKLKNAILSAEA